jgi:peptide/nickel transport system permease protein
MLSNGVQYVYDGYWWQVFPAGFCIIIVITAAIFIGEGLRDAVEVRLQRR